MNFFTINFVNDTYVTVPATLRCIGGHFYIFVQNSEWNNSHISNTDISDLSNAFEQIYPAETALIGNEYGGDAALHAHGRRHGTGSRALCRRELVDLFGIQGSLITVLFIVLVILGLVIQGADLQRDRRD